MEEGKSYGDGMDAVSLFLSGRGPVERPVQWIRLPVRALELPD